MANSNLKRVLAVFRPRAPPPKLWRQNPPRHRVPKTSARRQDPVSLARGPEHRPADRRRQGAHRGSAVEARSAL